MKVKEKGEVILLLLDMCNSMLLIKRWLRKILLSSKISKVHVYTWEHPHIKIYLKTWLYMCLYVQFKHGLWWIEAQLFNIKKLTCQTFILERRQKSFVNGLVTGGVNLFFQMALSTIGSPTASFSLHHTDWDRILNTKWLTMEALSGLSKMGCTSFTHRYEMMRPFSNFHFIFDSVKGCGSSILVPA